MKFFKKLRNIKKIQRELVANALYAQFAKEKKAQYDPLLKKCEDVVAGKEQSSDAEFWEKTVLNKMLAAAGNNPSKQVIFFRAWIKKLVTRIGRGNVKTSDRTIMRKQFIPYIQKILMLDLKRALNNTFGKLKFGKMGDK